MSAASAGPSPGVPLVAVDAAAEQAWNEASLEHPVEQPAARLWRYPAPAVVLGRSQQALRAAFSPGE